MASPKKRIAILGGGMAGIGAVTFLRLEGLDPVCFEKTDTYGGTFNYRETAITGVGSVMPTTVLTQNKESGAISFYPPPKEFSPFLRHSEYFEYLTSFYKQYNCEQFMKFNKEVIHVKKNGDYDKTGRFMVTVKDTITGEISSDLFDGVIVATGHFNIPKFVTFPGQYEFKGTVTHTHSLKSVEKFRGRNVLVVGCGCSALDAAVDISSVATKVYLSTRTGSHIMSRQGLFGYPYDYLVLRRYMTLLFDILPRNAVGWLFQKLFLKPKFDPKLFAVRPKYHIFARDPVINEAIFSKLMSGTVVMKRNVKFFTQNGVVFDGEDVATEIDDVILATGYTMDFSFLEKELIEIMNGRIHLYKCIFPPQLHHATLAFIALINPFGPGLPIGEMQLRWVVQVFGGKAKLPSREIMMKEINERCERNERDWAPSEFNSIHVDYVQYLDSIASEIGAKPKMLKYLFTDFPLFLKIAFGPMLPYQYRLEGPQKWEGARDAIMTSNERLMYAFTTGKAKPERSFK